MPLTSPYSLDNTGSNYQQQVYPPAPTTSPWTQLQPLPTATIPPGGIPTTPLPYPGTGGISQPQQMPQPITGGVAQPQVMGTSPPPLGGNTPPDFSSILRPPPLGGNTPPLGGTDPGPFGNDYVTMPPLGGGGGTIPTEQQPIQNILQSLQLPGINGQQFVAQAYGNNQVSPGIATSNAPVLDPNQAGQQVQGYLNDLLKSGNPYITNAARRGLETANSRGLLNSSIASGASTRSAIEAAQPILSEIMGLNNSREQQQFQGGENQAQRQLTATLDREGRAFQGEQSQLDRTQGVNNALLNSELGLRDMEAQSFYGQKNAQQDYEFRRALQNDSVAQQDWLTNQNFSREFNAGLAMLPIQNATELHNTMMQAALDQPEVYTPEVLSGFSNFFNNQFLAQMQMYFPRTSGGTP